VAKKLATIKNHQS